MLGKRPADLRLTQENAHWAVKALRQRWKDEPHELMWPFALCDSLTDAAQYREAVQVARRLVRMAPSNPRGAYALASSYHTLGRERWEEFNATERERAEAMVRRILADADALHLPEALKPQPATEAMIRACDKLGLTAEKVRELAVHWFEETLRLDLHPDDKRVVRQDLLAARSRLDWARRKKEVEATPEPGP